jgi:hypothetical protein
MTIAPFPCDAPGCVGTAEWIDYCAARVCWKCDKHHGLTRCYCGWSESGGDGRAELVDLGETIDPESGHLIVESLIFLAAVYVLVLVVIRYL